jgi:RHS repeat-associated protein
VGINDATRAVFLCAVSYISSGNGVNQVKTVTGFSGETKAFTYDTFGRTLTETDVIDGISFINTYTYDQYSNLLTVKYPSDLLITREYDANGYLATIKNGSTTIFENTSKNALGQYTAYTLGGNQAVEKTYNQYGVPLNFKANSGVIQNLTFDFELKTGNLTRRTDHRKGKYEAFTYDDINRLTSAQIGNIGAALSGELQNYTFADNGNITSKTGIGAYKYDPNKIHAVVEVENTTAAIPTISQFITYSAFQQPITITEGTNVLTYTYSADYQRIKGVISGNTGAILNKRYYFGDFERDITGAVTRDIHYVGADGLNCIIEKVGTNVSYYYVYKDYLGSILTVTNATGSIVEEKNYDAWGKNRNTNDWTYTNIPTASLTWMTRGYTGHEHLSQFGLINMNGRLYDPILGRMLSPDNYTHEGSQGYNRYSYAMNNPLKYTDPDGQNPVVGMLIGAGVSVITNGIKNMQGGQPFFKGAFQAAIWGLATGAFSFGIGSYAAILSEAGVNGLGVGAFQAVAHGIIGGVTSMGQGGSFASGAASGAVSSIIGSLTAGYGAGAQILAGGLSGGIASSMAGGNFWDGVKQGLITSGLNHALHGLAPTKLPDGRYIWELSDEEMQLFADPETRYIVTGCDCDIDLTVAERLYLAGKMASFAMPTARLATISKTTELVIDAENVLNSANSSYKGTTVLGHALSKHAGRNPHIWGKVTGNPSTWHSQGLQHFDDIMNSPGIFMPKTNPNGVQFLEKMLPDGRGMRLNMNKTFKGFID